MLFTVEEMNDNVGKEGPVRATMRLYSKTSFSRGVHLNLIDACPETEFQAVVATMGTLSYASRQKFIFRAAIWSGNIDDARFTVGNLLQLRCVAKVAVWNNILCGSCHCEDVHVLAENQLAELGAQRNP
ncbi:hypothetical protein PHMEG_00041989 [Phytophthora megakarya]|uniref:Uncharacterized protein n=1 Tax=Phytophthora megakarya TaxID=4795 RepID=A0A225UAU0_9STRA|nr:hypothetical protein PHMEG_00041989 [Phytophthora megakarya]